MRPDPTDGEPTGPAPPWVWDLLDEPEVQTAHLGPWARLRHVLPDVSDSDALLRCHAAVLSDQPVPINFGHAVFANPALPDDAAWELVEVFPDAHADINPYVGRPVDAARGMLARDRVPRRVLEWAVDHPVPQVAVAACTARLLDDHPDLVVRLVARNDARVDRALANEDGPALTDEQAATVAKRSPDVGPDMAARNRLPRPLENEVFANTNWQGRRTLLSNAADPERWVRRFVDDKTAVAFVEAALLNRNWGPDAAAHLLLDHPHRDIRTAAARRDDLPADVLDAAVGLVARNDVRPDGSDLVEPATDDTSADRSKQVLAKVAAHPNLSEAAVRRLAESDHVEVLLALRRRPPESIPGDVAVWLWAAT